MTQSFFRSTPFVTALSFAATLLPAAIAGAQTTAAVAPPVPTPKECMDTVTQYRNATIAAARAGQIKLTSADLAKGMHDKVQGCIARISDEGLDRLASVQLGALKMLAGDTASAIGLFDKAAEDHSGTAEARAAALTEILRATTSSRHADEYLAQLDAVPNVPVERFKARRMLMGYYQNYDIDDKLEVAARTMIELGRSFSPAVQQEQSDGILNAYRALAGLYANRLRPDSALIVLRGAPAQLPNLPAAQTAFAEDIARYEMIGKPATTVAADYWLNGEAKPYAGGVTVVLFTANWCHSCKDSYPTVTKINQELAPKGLRTVLAVNLDGQFQGVTMAPDKEVEANKTYFVGEHGFPYPIAIQKPVEVAGQPNAMPSNAAGFHLTGFPQFIVVDQKGIVRAVLTGWDPYGNRERALSAVVRQLLNA